MSAPAADRLVYLYVGTDDVERVWRFRAFGTEVGAVRLASESPLVLLAEHRPAPSCLPIWTVADLDAAVERLGRSGFEARGETVGTPDGPVHVQHDPSGNEIGRLQPDRPGALELEHAYADPDNDRAVR